MPASSDRMRVVVYYAIWATLCAAVAGTVVALVHTSFFAFNPGRSAAMQNLFQGIVTALAIAAGQGGGALVTGSLLPRFYRRFNLTVLLGPVIGVFDFVIYFLQMGLPREGLGWKP